VKLPSNYRAGDKVSSVPVKPRSTDESGSYIEKDERKHYLIDFFRINYIWAVFTRAPWYFCVCSILVLLVDLVLWNGCKYFMRLFARRVLNKTGLIGQYFDMLNYSQASICCGKLYDMVLQNYLWLH